MKRLFASAAVLVVGLTLIAGSAVARPGRSTAVKPVDLWLVLARWPEVKKIYGANYWPILLWTSRASYYKSPGELQYVNLGYGLAKKLSWEQPTVTTTLTLFDNDAHASAGLAERNKANTKAEVAGPSVGDESALFVFPPVQKGGMIDTLLFFRLGSLIGAVEVLDRKQAAPGRLVALVQPMLTRGASLLAGTLHATQVGNPLLAKLPARLASATLVTKTVLPLESWASGDSSGDPFAVRSQLRRYGQTQLPFAVYQYGPNPQTTLRVVFFPMRDAASATSWVELWLRGTDRWQTLPTGKTGPTALFMRTSYYDQAGYDLVFAAGKTVVDVDCTNRWGSAPNGCASTVRALAERLYAATAPKK